MMRAIKKIVTENDFDYVHADQLWMVQYALEARRCAQAAGKKLRVVLDQHNAVYLIPKRLMAITRNPFVFRLLRRLAQFPVRRREELQILLGGEWSRREQGNDHETRAGSWGNHTEPPEDIDEVQLAVPAGSMLLR